MKKKKVQGAKNCNIKLKTRFVHFDFMVTLGPVSYPEKYHGFKSALCSTYYFKLHSILFFSE